jgi:hypothetical protein
MTPGQRLSASGRYHLCEGDIFGGGNPGYLKHPVVTTGTTEGMGLVSEQQLCAVIVHQAGENKG